jgi:hypothetical protein
LFRQPVGVHAQIYDTPSLLTSSADITAWRSYRELAEYINTNVRAIVGPHGGGLMHLMWAARNTLVLEFQVEVSVNYAMWELSPLLEHNCEWTARKQGHFGRGSSSSRNKALQRQPCQLGHAPRAAKYSP